MFKKPKVIVEPAESITNSGLRALLKGRFPGAQIWLSDGDYKLCSPEYIDTILELDDSNKREYVVTTYDCDDFAYRLMGQLSVPEYSDLAFGIVWTDKHAMNVFVDNTKQVWFIEPQTDGRFQEISGEQGTKVLLVVI